ncbi:MAG: Spy/CpxP family protein refolding chaperone [Rhodocyclaceae bacterium]|nr:Spy/CpxP family protein refolding chaperone [Rhodocyclaceae bacterium]MCB1958728.1 Spy/CpxP family protein refolding chaperone [Rhodocyclaceae bacterium]
MKTRNRILVGVLAASSLALAAPFVAHANPFGEDGKRACATEGRHGGHTMRGGMGHHEGKHRDGMGMRGLMRGIDLTEAQRDKLFELRHAQAPAIREQWKAARAAREALRTLPFSGEYSEAQAQALSKQAAQAMAEIGAMRAGLQAEMYALLTDEQREALKARQARRDKGPGHWRGGPGRFAPEMG